MPEGLNANETVQQNETLELETPVVTPPIVVVNPPQQQTATRQVFTELITGSKLLTRSDGSQSYLVTTRSGKEVWIPVTQFNPDTAEQVTYSPVKKGDTWRNSKTGQTGVYQSDAYQFVNAGKQVAKKADEESVSDTISALAKQGLLSDPNVKDILKSIL